MWCLPLPHTLGNIRHEKADGTDGTDKTTKTTSQLICLNFNFKFIFSFFTFKYILGVRLVLWCLFLHDIAKFHMFRSSITGLNVAVQPTGQG